MFRVGLTGYVWGFKLVPALQASLRFNHIFIQFHTLVSKLLPLSPLLQSICLLLYNLSLKLTFPQIFSTMDYYTTIRPSIQ